jgi:Ca-activated chloride channel family protein
MIENIHFLRPTWLLALLPLAFLLWRLFNIKRNSRSWQAVVDPVLLAHLLSGNQSVRSNSHLYLIAVIGILSIVALAGPVWNKLEQPIFKQQSALVIVLDLSRSMDSSDIKPSRLIRARHKIADILTQRKEGQTALVVYAADAFSVVPLTDDGKTIKALLPGLTTDIMPTQGSRAGQALIEAYGLFQNTNLQRGDILLVTDGLTVKELKEAQIMLTDNPEFRLSVLGVGTETGGPIPLPSGGFLKDAEGSIVIASLSIGPLQTLVNKGGGVFKMMSANDDDVTSLLKAIERSPFEQVVVASNRRADVWQEQGPWLVLFVLPLLALAFRRGIVFGSLFYWPILLSSILLVAPPEASAFDWNELWKNNDQRALDQFDQGQPKKASELFDRADWKGSSFYRSGDYENALNQWQGIDSESVNYNRGNALAKLGKLQEALETYDEVLLENPQHIDAKHNRQLVEDALKQQQEKQSKQDESDAKDREQSKDDEQSSQSGQGQKPSDSDGQQSSDPSEKNQNQSNSNTDSEFDTDAQEAQAEQSQADTDASESKEAEASQAEQASREKALSEQAADQWLRKIPDDPGGLLRRKFLYQYNKRGESASGLNPW